LNRQDSTHPIALAVSGVEKTLGGTLVLAGVSFSAERGSLTAILGTSEAARRHCW
jgi:ABC-type multidrug transport system ATPase subunit